MTCKDGGREEICRLQRWSVAHVYAACNLDIPPLAFQDNLIVTIESKGSLCTSEVACLVLGRCSPTRHGCHRHDHEVSIVSYSSLNPQLRFNFIVSCPRILIFECKSGPNGWCETGFPVASSIFNCTIPCDIEMLAHRRWFYNVALPI